jgi:hypothetical protein
MDKPEKQGIKGWLLIPAIMTILVPIAGILGLVRTMPLMRYASSFLYLTFAVDVLFIVLGLVAVYALFAKKAWYPNLFIALCALTALWTTAMYFYIQGVNDLGQSMLPQLISAWTGAAIWIAYMLRSRRVKNTFVR